MDLLVVSTIVYAQIKIINLNWASFFHSHLEHFFNILVFFLIIFFKSSIFM